MGTSAALAFSPATRAGDAAGRVPSPGSVLGQLREVCATAVRDAALFGFAEAAEYAAGVEELARAVEYLQLVGAAAVDRTRKEAAAADSPVLDDGYRKSGEFLRDRLQITAVEAHRRL
ncbi:HNH endonuclease, partial [Arthrobacter sp. C9C5]|nr:HNH endonuclease [Arthrobacter sp. C9C5]